jgi:hypothetical protein
MERSMRAASETTQNPDLSVMPYREPLRTWAGHGTGARCNGCGGSIQAHEIEYEVELPPGSDAPTLHFHFVCYRNWTGRGPAVR